MQSRKPAIPCQVFLSHSTQDKWICERIKEKIEGAGGTVWMDAFDISSGRNIKEEIRIGLRSSTECLILLSPASRASDWVRHEAGLAHGLDIPTTLILLHVSQSDIPDPLVDLKYLEINNFDSFAEQLTRSYPQRTE